MRLTGRRINRNVQVADALRNEYVRTSRNPTYSDLLRTNVARVTSDRPPFAVDAEGKRIPTSRLRGAFDDDEAFDATVERRDGGDYMVLRKGKDTYGIGLEKDPYMPNADVLNVSTLGWVGFVLDGENLRDLLSPFVETSDFSRLKAWSEVANPVYLHAVEDGGTGRAGTVWAAVLDGRTSEILAMAPIGWTERVFPSNGTMVNIRSLAPLVERDGAEVWFSEDSPVLVRWPSDGLFEVEHMFSNLDYGDDAYEATVSVARAIRADGRIYVPRQPGSPAIGRPTDAQSPVKPVPTGTKTPPEPKREAPVKPKDAHGTKPQAKRKPTAKPKAKAKAKIARPKPKKGRETFEVRVDGKVVATFSSRAKADAMRKDLRSRGEKVQVVGRFA